MNITARVRITGLFAALAIAVVGGVVILNRNDSVSPHPLVWSGCENGFECANLDVPLDYDHPNGRKITLALARLPAGDAAHRIGALIVNPGGPGGSGIAFARSSMRTFPQPLRDRFDIVGFDPRGVGQSAPVRCEGTASATPAVTSTPQSVSPELALTRVAQFAQRCRALRGDELDFLDTTSSARDIERIRIALGEETLSYVGYSYGTFLGATYADLYPSRVRAFVLDGAVDPNLSFEDYTEQAAVASESGLKSFFEDCGKRLGCPYYANGDTKQKFEDLRRALDVNPLVVTYPSGTVTKISGSSLVAAAELGVFSSARWNVLARALADADFRHDGTGLANLLLLTSRDPGSDAEHNFRDAETVINCLDRPPPSFDELDRFGPTVVAEAPHFGDQWVFSAAECFGFHFLHPHAPYQTRAAGAAPILVIGTVADPATPYAWAMSLASELKSGRLLTWNGYGHTASLHNPSRSSCIDDAVTAYLIDVLLPAEGKICD